MSVNVLIVSHYDPTSPLVGALRVDAFGRHLSELGAEVSVVSRTGTTTYTRSGRQSPPSSEQHHFERPVRSRWMRRLRRAAVWVYKTFVAIPDRGITTARAISRHLRQLDSRPDVIVATGPPFTTMIVARQAAKRLGVPWVADYRDLWTISTYYECGPLRRRLDHLVERWMLKTVALTVTVSEPLADDMRRAFSVRCEVVRNGFEPAEFSEDDGQVPGLPLRIRYTGEVYQGKRDPRLLFDAIRSLGVGPDELQVEMWGITVPPFQELANRYQLGDVVTASPAVPRPQALSLQRGADILLLLMWNDPQERGNVTTKVYEYLGSTRPILILGYEDSAAATLVRARGAGVVCNHPEDIARRLRTWIEQKRDGGLIPGIDPASVADLSRAGQAQVLYALLHEVVDQSTR